MPKLRADQYFSLLLLVIGLLLVPRSWWQESSTLNAQAAQTELLLPAKLELPVPEPVAVPVYIGTDAIEDTVPFTTASSVYIMDRQSGAVLYQKDGEAKWYPASTAKMMTALVVRKTYELDDVLTVRDEAHTTGTVVGFQEGEQFSVRELLKALLIKSGNDAAFVLANNHPGEYAGFVGEMNALAQDLHLDHSTFGNPSGLDLNTQTSTARDLAILANELMKDEYLRELVGQSKAVVTDQSGLFQHPVVNTNELLGKVDGVVGIKTGTTEFASENLITQVNRDGHEVIIVALGSKDRFTDTRQLINWVFGNYVWEPVTRFSETKK